MDFLEHLVRKSQISGGTTEYFNYKPPVKRKRNISQTSSANTPIYKSLNDTPLISSYVVFDLETTGQSAGINAIVEIGAVKVENNVVTDKFSQLVNPRQYIPGFLTEKIHITNSMVSNAPYIEDVLPDFVSFINTLPLVAHNARFDMSFLLKSCADLNISIDNAVIDTLYLSRHHLKECSRHNLAYLTNFFNIDLKNAHRAYYDARATQQLFEIIKAHICAEQ